ncbi:AAA family ATPase [Streptomyces sp. LBUM 1476]|nr:AAA family ATPase [Streptomyces sp. LBUM 1476]
MSSVEPEPPGAEAAHEPATVVTFYSYKGGVGRTMALANVAWILATEGSRVLVVDWDLESPGLHRFYHPFLNDAELSRTTGVVDMVQGYGRGVEALLAQERAQELDEDTFEQHLSELLSTHTDVLPHRDTIRWSDFRPGAPSTTSAPASRTTSTASASPTSTGPRSTASTRAAVTSRRCANGCARGRTTTS